MKKLGVFFPVIILALFGIVFMSLYVVNKDFMNNTVNEVLNEVDSLNKYLNKYDYKTSGFLNVSAKYKGAHGESFPSDFSYKFKYENDALNIIDKSDYIRVVNNDKVLYFMKMISKLTKHDVVVKSINRNKITLDVNKINKKLNTKYNKAYIIVKSTGIVKKVDSIDIIVDDIKISKSKNEYNISYDGNDIYVSTSKLGYTLKVNNIFKMNAFFKKEKDSYSVVINDYVFLIELKNNEIDVKASSPSAIYNGMDIVATFDNDVNTDNLLIDNSIKNPIKRYLDSADLSYWRNSNE